MNITITSDVSVEKLKGMLKAIEEHENRLAEKSIEYVMNTGICDLCKRELDTEKNDYGIMKTGTGRVFPICNVCRDVNVVIIEKVSSSPKKKRVKQKPTN